MNENELEVGDWVICRRESGEVEGLGRIREIPSEGMIRVAMYDADRCIWVSVRALLEKIVIPDWISFQGEAMITCAQDARIDALRLEIHNLRAENARLRRMME